MVKDAVQIDGVWYYQTCGNAECYKIVSYTYVTADKKKRITIQANDERIQ